MKKKAVNVKAERKCPVPKCSTCRAIAAYHERKNREMLGIIAAIETKLDNVEDQMSWLIKPGQRFKVGDRVQFSRKAERQHLAERRKGGVRTGTVRKVEDWWSIDVLLDGYAKPTSYHHMLFDPLPSSRPRRRVPPR